MSKLFTITQSGNFNKTTHFLNYVSGGDYIRRKLDKYGQKGVEYLKDATPKDTGLTSESWDYKIEYDRSSCSITWTNDNAIGSTPIVILLQYGHATKNGGFVKGIDFINPAIQPVFEQLAEDVWREVTNA